METWETELRTLEEAVRKSDGDGLRARWESGRYMNTLKSGKKQLPKGLLAELVAKLGFRRAEVNARMKFAATYATEAELADVIGKFPTWYDITHKALTTRPRAPKPPKLDVADDEAHRKRAQKALLRAVATIETLDGTLLIDDQELLVALAAAVKNLMVSVRTLTAEAA